MTDYKKEVEEKLLQQGGIRYACEQCGKKGILLATSNIAISIRETINKPAPEPVTMNFVACVQHNAQEKSDN